MVCSSGERERELSMEIETHGGGDERSFKVPLHNFALPSFLKWGNQRQLRCMKLPEGNDSDGGKKLFDCNKGNRIPLTTRVKRSAATALIGEEGIDAVRRKIMLDLKTAAEKMRVAIFNEEATTAAVVSGSDDCEDEEEADATKLQPSAAVETKAEEEVKRWNLRTRRGPSAVTGKYSDHQMTIAPGVLSSNGGIRVAGGGGYSSFLKGANGGGIEDRKKFCLTLSRKEIDDDYMAIVGHRAPRRPKKRPRTAQRYLEAVFPGSWLTEVTVDSYKVPDVLPESGKR